MKTLITSILIVSCSFTYGQKGSLQSNTWQETVKAKKGNIVVYWDASTPFIFEGGGSKLTGVEYDILDGFKNFLRSAYHVELNIQWKKSKNFFGVIEDVKNSSTPAFGASSFSITPDRLQWIDFTPAYLDDISVIISSTDVPMAKSPEELFAILNDLTAVTVRGTTYERDLIKLQNQHEVKFSFAYVPNTDSLFKTLEQHQKSFAYIDLPVYLTRFSKDPNLKVRRQNFHALKRLGYGFIYSKGSDWQFPLNEYFTSKPFKESIIPIVGRYMEADIYEFLHKFSNTTDEDIELLTKEKEIQSNALEGIKLKMKEEEYQKQLLLTNAQLAEKNYQINLFITVAVLLLVLVGVMMWFYIAQKKLGIRLSITNKKIIKQKDEIEAKTAALQKNLDDLKRAQAQLVQSEKMASLGLLTAGIAHEINNPVNFISVGVSALERKFNQLNSNISTMITGLSSDSEISETQEKINQLINDIKIGTSRTEEIIASLRTFSHLDKAELKLADINEGIESTLVLLNSKFKDRIEIIKHLDAYLPHIFCYPGQLNQVILNMLSNAADAIKEKGKITIVTSKVGDHIQISIADTGSGISKEVQEKIFEPFFTTKEVGVGTGLGLSISNSIIQHHQGTITVSSEEGTGTELIISLPINLQESKLKSEILNG